MDSSYESMMNHARDQVAELRQWQARAVNWMHRIVFTDVPIKSGCCPSCAGFNEHRSNCELAALLAELPDAGPKGGDK